LNAEGKGFLIGEDGDTIEEAIEREGYTLIHVYRGHIHEAAGKGMRILVGGDAMGRNAWAVRIQ
jgi:hypothetical protein